jgi:hypothetical protein
VNGLSTEDVRKIGIKLLRTKGAYEFKEGMI